MPLKILLTNDDGFDAPGLAAMRRALKPLGDCFVSAPFSQRSASGHSVTIHEKIRVEKRYEKGQFIGYAIQGTPADCVKFAFSQYYGTDHPDFVVSGINPGPNTGVSVYYSGTIAAAREALLYHVPAFAVSITDFHTKKFDRHAQVASDVIRKIFKTVDGTEFFYNINIPVRPKGVKGVRITHQSHSRFEEKFIQIGKGKKETKDYLLRGTIELLAETGLSDEEAVRAGYVSVTPCQLDISAYKEIEKLERIFGRGRQKRR